MVVDHWFMQVEKVLEAMEIVSDTTKIRLAAFQGRGRRLLLHTSFKTRARMGHLVRQGR